ncbi:MAG: hypothetical protein HY335_05040, partial [Deinococcus sp.]|nr:hypothetical protein [Deinococcus sp.]
MRYGAWLVVLLGLAASLVAGQESPVAPADLSVLGRLPPVPVPLDNPMSPAKVELGKMLFFDPRLSGNGSTSCATCHIPRLGWGDGSAL